MPEGYQDRLKRAVPCQLQRLVGRRRLHWVVYLDGIGGPTGGAHVTRDSCEGGVADAPRGGTQRLVWVAPGGGLEKGELPSDGAVREVFEETGVRIQSGLPVWKRTHTFELEGRLIRQFRDVLLGENQSVRTSDR